MVEKTCRLRYSTAQIYKGRKRVDHGFQGKYPPGFARQSPEETSSFQNGATSASPRKGVKSVGNLPQKGANSDAKRAGIDSSVPALEFLLVFILRSSAFLPQKFRYLPLSARLGVQISDRSSAYSEKYIRLLGLKLGLLDSEFSDSPMTTSHPCLFFPCVTSLIDSSSCSRSSISQRLAAPPKMLGSSSFAFTTLTQANWMRYWLGFAITRFVFSKSTG